jgi:hypothetical protein
MLAMNNVTTIIDTDSVLGLLHLVHVGDVVHVSEIHAASIFRASVRLDNSKIFLNSRGSQFEPRPVYRL